MDRAEGATQRRKVLRRLMDRARADAASFHGLVRVAGELRLASPTAVGPEAMEAEFDGLDGRPQAEFEFDFAHAPPIDTFGRHGLGDVPAGVRDGWWSRFGLRDGLGASVCRNGRLVGTVFLYRHDAAEPFRPEDVAAANGQLRWARTQLDEVDPRDAARLDGAWVFAEDGTLLFGPTSRLGERGAALGRHVAAWAAGGGRSDAVVAGHAVSLTRVVGPTGPAIVARVEPAHPLQARAAMEMTPLKRRIASLAAQGATVPEIATALDRSPETVRTHLKRIYEHLGVASRVELAEACRVAWA